MTRLDIPTASGTVAAHVRGTPGPDTPTLVLTHGWPDDRRVWDLVADRLAERHHVVCFDARGVGGSPPVPGRDAYALAAMADDIDAVIQYVSPDRPVHLVGHDWGSVEGWELVGRPGIEDRVRSFTSLSGPNLDYLGAELRARTGRRGPSIRPVLAQAAMSAYTIVLSLPVVRSAIWRLGFAHPFRLWLRLSEGIRRDGGYPGPDVADDAVAAVGLYRTNIWSKLRAPDPRPVRVPVLVIAATRDRFVNATLAAEVGEWVENLTVERVAAGHWSPRTHPDDLARLISAHVARHHTAEEPQSA